MNKKGQIAETVGIIFLLSVFVVGSLGYAKIVSENRFIGNIDTMEVYDLKYCDVSITKDKMVSFNSQEEAHVKGFKDAQCNR